MARKRGKVTKPPVAKQVSSQLAIDEAPHPMQGGLATAKVCRLCENKNGPFHNIFGVEKNTAKKIDEVMPFSVTENDELPHNICFRCSAKVEELHEFIQKCTKTQQNFYISLGKNCPLTNKIKTHRSVWEETLNKSNKTNDDICDAVIKKAMDGIKDITVQPAEPKRDENTSTEKQPVAEVPNQKNDNENKKEIEPKKKKVPPTKSDDDGGSKNNNVSEQKHEELPTRFLRSRIINSSFTLLDSPKPRTRAKANINNSSNNGNESSQNIDSSNTSNDSSQNIDTNPENKKVEKKEQRFSKLFNIMSQVTMIKVNGVGVLFQCTLCNRNFLKREVVLSHWCAKNGKAKVAVTKKVIPPEIPKVSTVKYINTKNGNIVNNKSLGNICVNNIDTQNKKISTEEEQPVNSLNKPKPRIGPASRVRKDCNESVPTVGIKVTPREPSPLPPPTPPPPPQKLAPATPKAGPSFLTCGKPPSLNCRYKLVPGPNNTFSLVEILQTKQKNTSNEKGKSAPKNNLHNEKDSSETVTKPPKLNPGPSTANTPLVKSSSKRKLQNEKDSSEIVTKASKLNQRPSTANTETEIIDLDDIISIGDEPVTPVIDQPVTQPYPVGLFKSVKPHPPTPTSGLIPFVTSAQKKQSYTIVQTGNPSKLLISARPQHQIQEPEKKRSKKITAHTKSTNDQPLISLEEASKPADPELFNFMHLDPLLQPSYVLPTDESVIYPEPLPSTSKQINDVSKSKSVYTCNMCDMKFSREQKLLAHIHSHYDKMDEEDLRRQEKAIKKRSKKS